MRKLIPMFLAFLAGCASSLVVLHAMLTYAPARAEIWTKGAAQLILNRARETNPYWWPLSPTRRAFADGFRKELEGQGWVRVEDERWNGSKDWKTPCFFHFGRNSLGGAFFELYTADEYLGDGIPRRGAEFVGRRYASHDLKDVPNALKMCE